MGAEQFGRGVVNDQFAENISVDVQRNQANQFDTDEASADVSTGYETGEQNISGAKEVSGIVNIQDSNDADIEIEWTDGAGTVIASETPSELQGITDQASFNFIVKSTHFNLKINGTSTNTAITVNAH